MSSEQKRSFALVPRRLVVLQLMLTLVTSVVTQEACRVDKLTGLSLAYSVNRTGHPQLGVRLEQPSENPAWQLDVDLGTSKCGSSSTLFTVLKIILNDTLTSYISIAGYFQGATEKNNKHRHTRSASAPKACCHPPGSLTMSPGQKRSYALVPRRLVPRRLVVLKLVLTLVTSVVTQEACRVDKLTGLSLAYSVNRTGHPQFGVSLEQPSGNPAWQVDVDLGTTKCGSSSTLFTVLKLTLNGSPMKKTVPPGYTFLPELGYYSRPAQARNWTEARDFCNRDGASLAVPKTQEELDQLVNKFNIKASGSENNNCVWVGASDLAEKGTFVTVTGAPLKNETNLLWHNGQPSGHTSDRCVAYCRGGFYDEPCERKYAFFCS